MRRGNNWILIILVILLVIFGIYMVWGNGQNKRDSYSPNVQQESNKVEQDSPEDVMEIIPSDETHNDDIEIITADEEVDDEAVFY